MHTTRLRETTSPRAKPLWVALAAAALLAACAQQPVAPQSPAAPGAPSTVAPADVPRTLQAYEWDLQSVRDGQGGAVPGWALGGRPALRLHFEGNRVSVQNLCNMLGAGYSVDADRIQFGRTMGTLRACPDGALMKLETRVAAQLPLVQRYELRSGTAAPTLVLQFADQSRWELQGQPTAATRYGSAGEQVFLEVAPQKVACRHPLMRKAQCLRVRDVNYGANGVRQSVGEWRIFQGDIEGYEHRAGVRNVLRLKRYDLARQGQVPADGPRHAHVLDMVVESEQVR